MSKDKDATFYLLGREPLQVVPARGNYNYSLYRLLVGRFWRNCTLRCGLKSLHLKLPLPELWHCIEGRMPCF